MSAYSVVTKRDNSPWAEPVPPLTGPEVAAVLTDALRRASEEELAMVWAVLYDRLDHGYVSELLERP